MISSIIERGRHRCDEILRPDAEPRAFNNFSTSFSTSSLVKPVAVMERGSFGKKSVSRSGISSLTLLSRTSSCLLVPTSQDAPLPVRVSSPAGMPTPEISSESCGEFAGYLQTPSTPVEVSCGFSAAIFDILLTVSPSVVVRRTTFNGGLHNANPPYGNTSL